MAEKRAPGPVPGPIGDVVGTSMPRVEAREKSAGRAVYTDDMTLPGMLHGLMLGSPHAHARILSCDVSRARALPGVRAVLTAEDLPDVRLGSSVKDMPILARGKVRYLGEPVAAVAAVDLDTVRQALALVHIAYEPLPAVFDAEAALAPGAPVLHDGTEEPNTAVHVQLGEGHGEDAWSQCDAIVEGIYETQAQSHVYMEPCSTLAALEPGGKLTIWTSTQSVFRVQKLTSEALQVPMSRIRVIAPHVGGGFGGKTETTNQPITAALAMAANAPVKMTLSRTHDMSMMKSRHPCRIYMRTGATRAGELRAREVRMYYDTGAYADDGPDVVAAGVYFARGAYRIPFIDIEAWGVYTNKLRAAGFRGFGNPQITFASEVQIDELADRLGLDPIDFRLRNVLGTGEHWLGGVPVDSGTLAQCLERARSESGWDLRRPQTTAGTPGKRRGIGVAAVAHRCALLGTSAEVRLGEDGTVTARVGAVDAGQGAETVLTQCVSGALGLRVDQIQVTRPDTDAVPYDFGTVSSRVTFLVGKALTEACARAKEHILAHAAELLECAVRDLELRPGGLVGIQGAPGSVVTFAEVAARSLFVAGGPIVGTHSFVFPGVQLDPRRTRARGISGFAGGSLVFAAQVVEVEVDELTGKVELVRAWSVHDVGRAIHPVAVEGQILGGLVQGLGYALFEELVWQADGALGNGSMMGYKVPAALEVPMDLHPVVLEIPSADGPFGAKGVAEVGLIGVAPAVCNAIRHATGISVRQVPVTSERMLRALLG